MNATQTSLLESIPDSATVRGLLAEKLREAGILRQLLKAAEKKEKAGDIERLSRAEVVNAR